MKSEKWLSLLLTLALPIAAAAQSNDRSIAVDGQAVIEVEPDSATLRLGVQSRQADLESARSRVIDVTRAFLAVVDDLDIDRDQVQTTGLNIRPEYRWDNDDNSQKLLGYFVQRDIVIELGNLDKLGNLLERAVNAGVNQVQPPVLKHSNERELRRRALAAATRDARANARVIAETLDAELGAVISVSSHQSRAPAPPYPVMAMREASVAGAETYSSGQIRIEASVNAVFGIAADDN